MTETENLAPAAAVTASADTVPKDNKKEKKAASDKKEKKPKKAPEHPKYSDMITAALEALNDKSGSSRQALIKYISANYKIDESKCTNQLRQALKRLVATGVLKQVKGAGASGSFKLAKADDVKQAPAKKASVPKAAESPKKAEIKKSPTPATKKPKSKKKSSAKKSDKGGAKKGRKSAK